MTGQKRAGAGDDGDVKTEQQTAQPRSASQKDNVTHVYGRTQNVDAPEAEATEPAYEIRTYGRPRSMSERKTWRPGGSAGQPPFHGVNATKRLRILSIAWEKPGAAMRIVHRRPGRGGNGVEDHGGFIGIAELWATGHGRTG